MQSNLLYNGTHGGANCLSPDQFSPLKPNDKVPVSSPTLCLYTRVAVNKSPARKKREREACVGPEPVPPGALTPLATAAASSSCCV